MRGYASVFTRLGRAPSPGHPKPTYLAGLVALSELVYASETISAIIFKEGILDILRESSLIQYFKQEGIEQGGRHRAAIQVPNLEAFQRVLDE